MKKSPQFASRLWFGKRWSRFMSR